MHEDGGIFDQSEFDVRCEWGAQGIQQLAPVSDVIIIVDVLSFSTCVEIATARGAIIFPYAWHDDRAQTFGNSVNAELAGLRRDSARYTLSPQSLLEIPRGMRLVLPSPNGSTLTLATGKTPTLAGCLRNANAVAAAAQAYGNRIAIIPAGERWQDGSLRPAIEDWIGGGAIINALNGSLSPEARAARAAFREAAPDLSQILGRCISGQELVARDFAPDVVLAAAHNVSDTVPTFKNGAYCAEEL